MVLLLLLGILNWRTHLQSLLFSHFEGSKDGFRRKSGWNKSAWISKTTDQKTIPTKVKNSGQRWRRRPTGQDTQFGASTTTTATTKREEAFRSTSRRVEVTLWLWIFERRLNDDITVRTLLLMILLVCSVKGSSLYDVTLFKVLGPLLQLVNWFITTPLQEFWKCDVIFGRTCFYCSSVCVSLRI